MRSAPAIPLRSPGAPHDRLDRPARHLFHLFIHRTAGPALGAQVRRAHHRLPATAGAGGALRRFSGRAVGGAARGARAARDRAALQPPARGLGSRVGGRARRRGHADGVGQDALLQPAGDRGGARGAGQGAVPVPDQGAGAGPGRRTARAQPRRRPRRARVHVRRRHAGRRAPGDPHARRHRRQQSGHAAPGDPAASHQVGAVLREPALRRHRRGAHLPRRVRLARRQRDAAPAPRLRVLRRDADLHPVLGDDRQSEGARRGAARRSGARDHRERRAARRTPRAAVESAGDQSGSRHPRLGALAVDAPRARMRSARS